MSLVLPRIHVDRNRRFVMESRVDALSRAEREMLLELENGTPGDALPGNRFVPLPGLRWLVGSGVAGGALWRVVEREQLLAIGHPAWLWTEESWFDPTFPETGPQPRAVALRRSLRHAARLTDSTKKMTDAVAATVHHLRRRWRSRGSLRPLAIVAPREALGPPRYGGRWFLLSVLACLPPEISLDLRFAAHEPTPDPERWDVVLTDRKPRGFEVFDVTNPPAIGDDVVAWYVRRRLAEGEPELVEAMAPLWDAGAADPWGSAIEKALADEGPGRIALDAELHDSELPTAQRLVMARLRAADTLSARLAKELAAVTVRTGHVEPWFLLESRSDADRMRAFRAWLAVAHKYPPDNKLLAAVARVRPPGALALPWCTGLLRWFLRGNAAREAPGLLLDALAEPGDEPSLAARASVMVELVHGLVVGDRALDALVALLHPSARALASRGAARSLADAWLLVPRKHRTRASLEDLVATLVGAPDGPEAVARLWEGVTGESGSTRAAEAIVAAWAKARATGVPLDDDPVAERIVGTDYAVEYVRTLAVHAEHVSLRELIAPVVARDHLDLWVRAESEWAMAHQPTPRDRFVALYAYLPEGATALERHARGLLAESLRASDFPDNVLADVAAMFADVPDGSSLWMWAAITASLPGQFDDEVIDATVVAFCSAPPVLEEDRHCGLTCAQRLGTAAGWLPRDIARWVVRLLLAPDGDLTGFPTRLCQELIVAVTQGDDGIDRLVEVTNELLTLHPDHPALTAFIDTVLPGVWLERPPRAFLQKVRIGEAPAKLRQAWAASVARRG